MSSRSGRFRPAWWATVGTLLLGSVFLAAGFWQLSRASQKRSLLNAFDTGVAQRAVPAPRTVDDFSSLRYRTIEATGRYDAGHQVLLDARIRNGKAGYEILTPLLTGSDAILVNRGWVAADPDRGRLPDTEISGEQRTVTGLLDRLPKPALALDRSATGKARDWPQRMLYPTTAEIAAALGYPVRNYQLLLSADMPGGYVRDWRPALLAPRQHLGYAVQWFALAATLVVIYVVLSYRRADRA